VAFLKKMAREQFMMVAFFQDRFWSVVFRLGAMTILLVLLVWGTGCSGISDDDLANLQKENQTLAAELEMEKRQADILNRALTSVYKERDRLVDLINQGPPPEQTEAQEGENASPEETTSTTPRVYVVQAGDTLGVIARRHQTTVAVLLTLNPFLRSRNDYMVWENDRLTLPR
jgi:hypothetical protein